MTAYSSGLVNYFGSLRQRFERQDDAGIPEETARQIVGMCADASTGLEKYLRFLNSKVGAPHLFPPSPPSDP